MIFKISWTERALQGLNKFEKEISYRIIKKVDTLLTNPFSKDIKRLKGMDIFRLRVGDYRVLFEIEGNSITILKIGHRRNIY